SMGLNGRLPVHLKQWLGGTGVFLGETILYLNNRLYAFPGIGQIRFPMRWLIPGSLMFFVGAGYGLANIYRHPRIKKVAFLISTIFALFGALNNLRSSRIDLGFPMQTLPKVEFAEWIQEQDGFGSVLLVPNKRPPPDSGKRSDLPVFANISPTLASSDNQYFQVIHGRPIYAKPNLKTLSSQSQNTEIARLVRNWDDMALPMLTANKPQPSKIPPSAYDPRSAEKRKAALEAFLTKGLRWIVLDKETYNDQAMEILRDQITRYIVQEKEFDDGTGVIIFEVALPD
ncbi:MAG: hypothetical protein VX278_17710, partial [Myxococcota bacterium]|nr:hypothetical protein [Myxococcota bacterium]